jgi:hypothetical protein
MANFPMDEYELRQMELYLRDARLKLQMGQALAYDDFVAWARHAATWLLDKIELGWNWIRHMLGLL